MADKKINIMLGINADVTQAKKNLQELQKSLATITNNQTDITMTQELKEASAEATKLRAILSSSTTNT